MKDRNGSLLKGKEGIQERWSERLMEFLNQSRPVGVTAFDALPKYSALDGLDQLHTTDQLNEALNLMAKHKAPGVD